MPRLPWWSALTCRVLVHDYGSTSPSILTAKNYDSGASVDVTGTKMTDGTIQAIARLEGNTRGGDGYTIVVNGDSFIQFYMGHRRLDVTGLGASSQSAPFCD